MRNAQRHMARIAGVSCIVLLAAGTVGVAGAEAAPMAKAHVVAPATGKPYPNDWQWWQWQHCHHYWGHPYYWHHYQSGWPYGGTWWPSNNTQGGTQGWGYGNTQGATQGSGYGNTQGGTQGWGYGNTQGGTQG
ncbi:hypothetical protein ACWEN3_32090 [Streptomyces sp. NPDC004561]